MMNLDNREKFLVWTVFLIVFVFLLGYVSFNTGYLIQAVGKVESHFSVINAMYERAARFQEIKVTFC